MNSASAYADALPAAARVSNDVVRERLKNNVSRARTLGAHSRYGSSRPGSIDPDSTRGYVARPSAKRKARNSAATGKPGSRKTRRP